MKHILGVSAGFHDAAVSVIREDGEIVFAGHSERYSKIKNDPDLHPDLLEECCQWDYDTIAYYERPWMHNYQQWRSGQKNYGPWTVSGALKRHLGQWYQHPAHREVAFHHHLSHAAAGFQTSPFEEAAVVVIDAIGEMDTISIYHARYKDGHAHYKKLWGQKYPHSIGLFYSAITSAIGLKPMEEEYITMGMAAYGSVRTVYGSGTEGLRMMLRYVQDRENIRFQDNLHAGFAPDEFLDVSNEDIAAAAQWTVEDLIMAVMRRAQALTGSDNLVYMGGVALNCVANSRLGQIFPNIWIMPNPGDAGSSLGAAALAHGGRLTWRDAYLGRDIPGRYPVKPLLDDLIAKKIVGVASGRAEFGPRALGNRSLLADPRGTDIRDRVNEIKQRQKFRPFAAAVLVEHVDDYFKMPTNYPHSPYMQVVAEVCRPDLFPSITHVDSTCRVQTVHPGTSGIRRLLEAWYLFTGCPMLLNTSLNVRGEPMVNDRADAARFEQAYGIRVHS